MPKKFLVAIPVVLTASFITFYAIPENPPEYNRKKWGSWIDADRDCQNTRQEVLISESLIPVTFKTERNCKVVAGKWYGAFTGLYYTDPSKLDIDHMIPLHHAFNFGGRDWSREKKRKFANDLENSEHLIAVYRSANRRKGSRSPQDWMPSNLAHHCQYLKDWVRIKMRWKLFFGLDEYKFLESRVENCQLKLKK